MFENRKRIEALENQISWLEREARIQTEINFVLFNYLKIQTIRNGGVMNIIKQKSYSSKSKPNAKMSGRKKKITIEKDGKRDSK